MNAILSLPLLFLGTITIFLLITYLFKLLEGIKKETPIK